jgi:epoxyqueuosine reductase
LAISRDLKIWIQEAAHELGFDLCGTAPAELDPGNRERYLRWIEQGRHGEMTYMTRQQRRDLRSLLPGVRSVICVGVVYNSPHPRSIECNDSTRGWIARYAWGDDYHAVLRKKLEQLLEQLRAKVGEPFDASAYVDTGPVLERALAWAAGLGWIAKNTCLIHENVGSWFFLGEILTSLELAPDQPAWDRCGTCTRCLDACPTGAIVEPYVLDATRCISYYTIEVKGSIPEEFRSAMGRHVFGCDICQDVCPWNREALVTLLPEFQPRALRPSSHPSSDYKSGGDTSGDKEAAPAESGEPTAFDPPLELLATLTEDEFREVFRNSPVPRPRYRGFLRNVAVAMGNSGDRRFRPALEKLAQSSDPIVQEHALWALRQLQESEAPARPLGQACDQKS